MLRFLAYIIAFLIAPSALFAQQGVESSANGLYCSPLDIPLSLSANFGEIRTTHFHSGVDFKSGGVVGQRVVSVAEGYVSRISISPSGYGNAIYISHPKLGTQSVYGHLDSFRADIAKYVESQQYKSKRFSQNLYPPKTLFPLKKGEMFALSGNSGSSGGPHLHFEIRDGATSHTLSPLKVCGYLDKITDNIPPRILSVNVVGVDESYGIMIHQKPKRYATIDLGGGKYKISGDTITLERDSYMAFEVTERKNGTTNIYGVTSMDLECDGQPFWGYNIKSLSFDYGRAINSFVLHPETTQNRNDFIRTYIAPENRLNIYTNRENSGVVYRYKLMKPKRFTLTASDEFGNNSTVSFVVRSSGGDATGPIAPPEGDLVLEGKYHTVAIDDAKLMLSPQTLQQSTYLSLKSRDSGSYNLSKVITLKGSSSEPPFNKSARLQIKLKSDAESIDRTKLVVCWISESGKLSSVGGKYSLGYVEGSVTGCGDYVVMKDTTRPTIISYFKSGEKVGSLLKVKIDDDLAGIASYNGYIDGKWVLFVYDAKSGMLSHKLSTARVAKGINHSCKIVVSDKVGNVNTLYREFSW